MRKLAIAHGLVGTALVMSLAACDGQDSPPVNQADQDVNIIGEDVNLTVDPEADACPRPDGKECQ